MKCPNCGFETESAFCQMCGTKISEALHTPNNETTETEYTSPLPHCLLCLQRHCIAGSAAFRQERATPGHATPRPVNSTRSSCSSCCSCTTMPIRTDTPAASASCSLPERVPHCSPPGGRTGGCAVCPAGRGPLPSSRSRPWLSASCPVCTPWPLLPPTAFWQLCSIPPLGPCPNATARRWSPDGRSLPQHLPCPIATIIAQGCRMMRTAAAPTYPHTIIINNIDEYGKQEKNAGHGAGTNGGFRLPQGKSRRTKDENGSLLRPVGQGDGRIRLFVFEAPGL